MQMIKNADREAISSLIGAVLMKSATGLIAVWGSINIYFFSYLRQQGQVISSSTSSTLLLCSFLPISLAVLASTKLANRFGYEVVIKVCAFVFGLSLFILSFQITMVTIGIFWLLIPSCGFAIGTIPIINCLWTQFPNDMNKVSGMAVLSFSAGMILWNLVFMAILNPNNEEAIIDQNGNAYFGQSVTKNLSKAILIVSLICSCLYVFGSFLIKKKYTVNSQNLEELEEQSPPQNETDKIQCIGRTESDISHARPENLLQGIKDIRFILLSICSFLMSFYLIYLNLNLKLIYMPIINDDHFLAFCAILSTVAAMIGSAFWGYLGDRNKFRLTFLQIATLDVLIKLFGVFVSSKVGLLGLFFLLGFNDKGFFTIIGPGFVEIFGLELATELFPFKGLTIFLAYMITPLIQLTLSAIVSYQVLLSVFTAFAIGALIISIYFYRRYEKKNQAPLEFELKKRSHSEQQCKT